MGTNQKYPRLLKFLNLIILTFSCKLLGTFSTKCVISTVYNSTLSEGSVWACFSPLNYKVLLTAPVSFLTSSFFWCMSRYCL